MDKNQLAYITPKVLTWAIDRSDIPRDEFARQIRVEPRILEAWERGLGSPQFSKAQKVAELLHVPFAALFLSEPPNDDLPVPDRRTLPGTKRAPISPEFRLVLTQALEQRDWYHSYLAERDTRPLTFGGFTENSVAADIAQSIRENLSLSPDTRKDARDRQGYLRILAKRIEDIGVLVMRRGVVHISRKRVRREEFQGFALWDPLAPLIFVNINDYQNAQIFTLVHELAHIWIGESGISFIDESGISKHRPHVEKLCESVAAETLVPKAEFTEVWERKGENISAIANHFLVSEFVILRRARELGKLSRDEFYSLRSTAEAALKPLGKQKKADNSGGSFYNTLDARNSPTFVDTLFADVRRDGTTLRDAAHLLNMKVPSVANRIRELDTT